MLHHPRVSHGRPDKGLQPQARPNHELRLSEIMAVDKDITGHPAGVAFSSRRRLLSGGLAAAIGIPICRPPLPQDAAVAGSLTAADGRLFSDCDSFDRLDAEFQALQSGSGMVQSVFDELQDEQARLVEAIAGTRALTIAGIRRRADSLVTWAEDILKPSECWDQRLIAATLRDLRGLDVAGLHAAQGDVA